MADLVAPFNMLLWAGLDIAVGLSLSLVVLVVATIPRRQAERRARTPGIRLLRVLPGHHPPRTTGQAGDLPTAQGSGV